MDSRVVAALRQSWRQQYPSSDEDVADQEVELMKARGHCSYMALEEGVQARHFTGVSNFLAMQQYVQVATDAMQMLDADACYAAVDTSKKAPKQKGKPRSMESPKQVGDKPHTSTAKESKQKNEKLRTVAVKDGQPKCERGQLRLGMSHDVKGGKPIGVDMWEVALAKAQAEMDAEFNYNALCVQGKQLFKMVLQGKVKRLYNKIKARAHWKAKKQQHADQ